MSAGDCCEGWGLGEFLGPCPSPPPPFPSLSLPSDNGLERGLMFRGSSSLIRICCTSLATLIRILLIREIAEVEVIDVVVCLVKSRISSVKEISIFNMFLSCIQFLNYIVTHICNPHRTPFCPILFRFHCLSNPLP